MRCLQCGKRVSLLRKLTDGEFCSDEHRQLFQQQQNDLALARLIEAQQGMSRPRREASPAPAPSPAPAKPQTKSAGKQATEEKLPPFGGFLVLPTTALHERRVHVPALAMVWPSNQVAIPAPEFQTKIQGIGSIGGVAIPAAGACGAQREPSGATLTWLAGWHLPELPPTGTQPEIAALLPPPTQEAQADPPMAELMTVGVVSALGRAENAFRVTEPVRAAGTRAPGRRLPAREGEETAPAPQAGLFPLRLVAASLAYRPFTLDPGSLPARRRLLVPVVRWAVENTAGLGPADAVFALPLSAGVLKPEAERRDMAPGAVAWPAGSSTLPREASQARSRVLAHEARLFEVGNATVCASGFVVRGWAPGHSRSELAGGAASLPAATLFTDPFEFAEWLEQRAERVEAEEAAPASYEILLPVTPPGSASLPAVTRSRAGSAAFEGRETALPLVETEPVQEQFDALLERLTAPPAPADQAEPVESSQAVPVEDEAEDTPPLWTRLQPILVWRLCEPPPVEIRTPSVENSTLWNRALEAKPGLPGLSLRPDNAENAATSGVVPRPTEKRARVSLRSRLRLPESWKVWQHAPADLKWVAVGLPLILALVLYSFRGSQPKEEAGVKLATSQSQSILGGQFASLQKVIMQRAAIHLLDDFRGGLSAWEGKPGWAKSWKYGQATFLEPGQLAVYKPTLQMKDYTVEFLGQIERQGLSWVVRADESLRNYHVMRLVVTRPGPLPEAAIVRYTVTDGKEGAATTLPLPFPIKLSTMYRVRVEVSGKEITTYLQGQVVDSFTDTRLRGGGVGFFAAKGEKALLRWVEVTHQYDYLGRFCAVLAPYDVQAGAERAD